MSDQHPSRSQAHAGPSQDRAGSWPDPPLADLALVGLVNLVVADWLAGPDSTTADRIAAAAAPMWIRYSAWAGAQWGAQEHGEGNR